MSIGKVLTIIFGVFFLLLGISLTISGIAIFAVSSIYTDGDGYLTTPQYQLSQPGSVAITMSHIDINIKDTTPQWIQNDLGKFVKLRITLSDPSYFIGIGNSTQVEKYLSNVTYTEINNFDLKTGITYKSPTNPTSTADLSTNKPLNETSFLWDAIGQQSVLNWAPKKGSWTIVIMKIDGTKGIDVGVKAGVKIPLLTAIAMFLVVFGMMFVILALVMFVIITRSNKTKIVHVNQYVPSMPAKVQEYPTQANVYGVPSQKVQGQPSSQPPSDTGTEQIYVVAEWGPRILAFILDVIIVSIFVEMVRLPVIFSDPTNRLLLYPAGISINGLVLFVYFTLLESNYGTTIGKQILKIQVITEDGRLPTYKESAISAVGKVFFLPIDLLIGVLMKDTDHEVPLSQRLMQKVSKTLVIVKPTSQPSMQYIPS